MGSMHLTLLFHEELAIVYSGPTDGRIGQDVSLCAAAILARHTAARDGGMSRIQQALPILSISDLSRFLSPVARTMNFVAKKLLTRIFLSA
jgi:hypothetical protein